MTLTIIAVAAFFAHVGLWIRLPSNPTEQMAPDFVLEPQAT